MRFACRRRAPATPIAFDDRISNQGGSPVETILAALGACTAMDVISIATKKRQAIEQYEIHVTGSQRDEYPQVFTEIDVVHEVDRARPVRGGDPPLHRAVGDEVLPGQRDALGRRDRGPPPLPDPVDAATQPYEAEGEVIATGPYAAARHPGRSAVGRRVGGSAASAAGAQR